MSSIRLLIVDDTPSIRTFLHQVLGFHGDFEMVGEAGDGRTAVEMACALEPDVIVMDYDMPVLDGVEATRQILARRPKARVIGFSSHIGNHVPQAMIQAGAVDYVPKHARITALIEAIRKAANPTRSAAELAAT